MNKVLIRSFCLFLCAMSTSALRAQYTVNVFQETEFAQSEHAALGTRPTPITDCPMRVENLAEPFVIVPLDRWSRITEKGLRFALKISDQVQAVHVDAEECCDEVQQMWQQNVAAPLRESGKTVPELILLSSPYRFVITPLVEYILKVERDHPDRQIAVLVPELVVKHWWQTPLHNQRAQLLKLLLLVRGNQRIMVINIPWYL